MDYLMNDVINMPYLNYIVGIVFFISTFIIGSFHFDDYTEFDMLVVISLLAFLVGMIWFISIPLILIFLILILIRKFIIKVKRK